MRSEHYCIACGVVRDFPEYDWAPRCEKCGFALADTPPEVEYNLWRAALLVDALLVAPPGEKPAEGSFPPSTLQTLAVHAIRDEVAHCLDEYDGRLLEGVTLELLDVETSKRLDYDYGGQGEHWNLHGVEGDYLTLRQWRGYRLHGRDDHTLDLFAEPPEPVAPSSDEKQRQGGAWIYTAKMRGEDFERVGGLAVDRDAAFAMLRDMLIRYAETCPFDECSARWATNDEIDALKWWHDVGEEE